MEIGGRKMRKMGRKPWYDKNGMKKGAWSKEEDLLLTSYIHKYGHWNWRQLPKFAGLSRCGKSCRLRWLNYLQQNIKRGNFTKEEEDLILKLREERGNKWADIARSLPGRTDNEIKNYWHAKLKRHAKENSATSNMMTKPCPNSLLEENKKELGQDRFDIIVEEQTSQGCSNNLEVSSKGLFTFEFDHYALLSDINLSDKKDNINSIDPYCVPNGNFWTEPFLSDEACSMSNINHSSTSEFGDESSFSYFPDYIKPSDQLKMEELLYSQIA